MVTCQRLTVLCSALHGSVTLHKRSISWPCTREAPAQRPNPLCAIRLQSVASHQNLGDACWQNLNEWVQPECLLRSPQLMVASAVAAMAAVQQASAIQQPFVKRAAARKAGHVQAMRLRRLLLKARLLLLTRQCAVQATWRQLQPVAAAGGCGGEGIPLGAWRAEVAAAEIAAVSCRCDAAWARRSRFAAAPLGLRQLLLRGCVQVAYPRQPAVVRDAQETDFLRLHTRKAQCVNSHQAAYNSEPPQPAYGCAVPGGRRPSYLTMLSPATRCCRRRTLTRWRQGWRPPSWPLLLRSPHGAAEPAASAAICRGQQQPRGPSWRGGSK